MTRAMSWMARVELQWVWRLVHKVAIVGQGYMNAYPQLNGENRELARFAQDVRARSIATPFVLDIGANEGTFAAQLLEVLPEAMVHCFEPHPATSARLRTRFADDSRVTVHSVGVGAEVGALLLHDYPGGAGSEHASFLDGTFADVWHSTSDTTAVPIVTVDSWRAQTGVPHIDLVKIDVEGFERNVLLGMSESLRSGVIDRVQFEFNAHNALIGFTLYETGRLLDGFDIFRLLTNGRIQVFGPDLAYDSAIEIFEYSNYVAIRRRTAPKT